MQLSKFFVSLALASVFSCCTFAGKVTVVLGNRLGFDRCGEMAEIDVSRLKIDGSVIVQDCNGNEIPSQLTYDGKLIFQANVPGKGKSTYCVCTGNPAKYERKVMGRLFTERQDEFGWENDKVAYRIYGHGSAVGYDLFNKKTSKLMLDHWYASEQDAEMRSVVKKLQQRGYRKLADELYNAFCYHIDHGEGMDCYTVGPTLGGGGNAIVKPDGSFTLPQCYEKFQILDEGPLRFTVKLSFPAVDGVTETRIVSLDAGSHFCKVTVNYEGIAPKVLMASGVVVHQQNPDAYVMNRQEGYIGYEDLGDGSPYAPAYRADLEKEMGRIYVGTVYPRGVKDMKYVPVDSGSAGIAVGHVVAYTDEYTYFFGSAWDKNEAEGIVSLAKWEQSLMRKAQIAKSPLRIDVR